MQERIIRGTVISETKSLANESACQETTKGQRTKDKRQRTNDKRQTTKDKGQKRQKRAQQGQT
jgi:hypothetical protein